MGAKGGIAARARVSSSMARRAGLLVVLACSLWCQTDAQLKKRNEVSIGYMLNYHPWKLAVNLGTFERVTGFTIIWLEITDSYKATIAMANNEVELVVANSADIARAFSRGLPARLVYINEENHNSEALVVHNSMHAKNGGPIRSPKDLIGREIHVWYGSTAHYSLWAFLNEMQIPIEYDTTYMRGVECTKVPCHYTRNPRAVTLISRDHEEILTMWHAGEITACYVGLPELNDLKHTGEILFTNAMTSRWEKVTFSGVLARNDFLDKTDPKYANYPVSDFMVSFIWEMAKSNYYYMNNTKEFAVQYVLDTIGTNRVSGAIASVTGSALNEGKVFEQLRLRQYPSLPSQISCDWMGAPEDCHGQSRVAAALKDMAVFLMSIKEDWNVINDLTLRGLGQELYSWRPTEKYKELIKAVSLAEVKDDYSIYMDTSYIREILAAGQDGSYLLDTGAYVHLGYEVMAMFGPTRSLLIS